MDVVERAQSGSAPAVEVTVDVTTELRWFFGGRAPEELLSWFTSGGAAGMVDERRDAYRLDGQVDIGVKRRAGTTLELKLRLSRPEPYRIKPGVEGRLELWQRWSPADNRIYLSEHTTWVDVDKTIVKRRFAADGRELVLTPDTRAMTGEGCDAEIATIVMNGRPAWTFAFAAFGPADGHRTSLRSAWHAVTGGRPHPGGLRLDRTCSSGYPEWLATELGPVAIARPRDAGSGQR